ncbi:DNA mismatch repair protein [Vibrio sp. SCSIO 43137]|uniref:DNA mismatch repair protein n=1 Tax=Vibrio sp. SCSIO 43137 TaxID=3021011 RepID=UPI002307436B|nr:DNA mismatch repair protein [Vibrio sp. SCSIO 43137]WCE31590.1 DNA mismatch repair protein [Vibrio sp. SCSIO 43137]
MPQLRLPPAWVIVLFGLVLNIFAILINSVVLDKYALKQGMLNEKKAANQQSIERAWNRIETLERKREVLIVHLGQSNRDEKVAETLRQQLFLWVDKDIPPLTTDNLSVLTSKIDDAQAQERNNIDNLYFKNVSLMEVIQQMEETAANYKNIALFLQIFGLALILARDLTR